MATERQGGLVGNRLVLVGTVLYLLEWVAIFGSGLVGVPMIGGDPTLPPDQLTAGYAGTEGGLALIAGWMALVLSGRVLLVVGVRAALHDSGRPSPLLDFAVAMMAVSIALEIAATALYAAAAAVVAEGAPLEVLALNEAATAVGETVVGPFGIAVGCAAWAMWRSGLFSRALCVLGLAGGIGLALIQLTTAPALRGVYDVLFGFVPLLMWVWGFWTGIVLWRRTPRRSAPLDPVGVSPGAGGPRQR